MLNSLGRISRSTSIHLALIWILSAMLASCADLPKEAGASRMLMTISAIEDQERRTMALNSVLEAMRLLTEMHMVSDPCYPDRNIKINALACRESGHTIIPLIYVTWADPTHPDSSIHNEMKFRQDGELSSYFNARAYRLASEHSTYLENKSRGSLISPETGHGEDASSPEAGEGIQVAQLNPFSQKNISPPELKKWKPARTIVPDKDWLTSPVLQQRAFTLLRALKPVSWASYKPISIKMDVSNARYAIFLEGMANGLPCEGRRINMTFEISAGDLIHYEEFRVEMTYPAMSSSLLSVSEARNRAFQFLKHEEGSKAAVKIRLHKTGIAFPDDPYDADIGGGPRDLDKPTIYYYYDVEIPALDDTERHLAENALTGEVFYSSHGYGRVGPREAFEAGDYFP